MLKELMSIAAIVMSVSKAIPTATSSSENDVSEKDWEIINVDADSIAPLSVVNYPHIDGFNHIFSYEQVDTIVNNDHPDQGFMHMDLDLYTTRFTSESILLLVHTKTQGVSGWVAAQNHPNDYDAAYDLQSISVTVDVPRIQDRTNGFVTGSVHRGECWPKSYQDEGTATVRTSTGLTLTLGDSFEAGIDAGGATIKESTAFEIGLSFSRDTTITNPDPLVSSNFGQSGVDNAFNHFDHSVVYKKYGKVAYTFDAYDLYEIVEDGRGFNDGSFVIRYSATTDVVKNKDLPLPDWPFAEKHTQITKNFEIRFNLGYNPSYVTYFA